MKYWNNRLTALESYVPGEQPKESGWIKLNTNENPWPPSPAVLEAMRAATMEHLERYPDPEVRNFCDAAARYVGVPTEYIFAGNGSDEILAFAFGAFFNDSHSLSSCEGRDRTLLLPDVTYNFYRIYAGLWSIPYTELPLDDDFNIRIDDYRRPSSGVVLCNPNAPTGRPLSKRDLLELVRYQREQGSLMLVDEAYVEFGADSVACATLDNENLLVVRTLSKSKSLAGLRVGYAVGNPNLIQGLRSMRNMINSYTLGTIAQRGAAAALNDNAYYAERISELVAVRERTRSRLLSLGWKVLPSSANFLFVSCPGLSGAQLYAAFRDRKVLVRYWDNPRVRDYIRISIGNAEAMESFCKIAEAIWTNKDVG